MTFFTGVLFEAIAEAVGPQWASLICGYAVVWFDGEMYLTDLGDSYLAMVDA
jgi:hypothetical protein